MKHYAAIAIAIIFAAFCIYSIGTGSATNHDRHNDSVKDSIDEVNESASKPINTGEGIKGDLLDGLQPYERSTESPDVTHDVIDVYCEMYGIKTGKTIINNEYVEDNNYKYDGITEFKDRDGNTVVSDWHVEYEQNVETGEISRIYSKDYFGEPHSMQ